MGKSGWVLEVVRGREVGRAYPLGAGASVLGGSPGGAGGIDLGAQEEAQSPRRMAARQAQVVCDGEGLSLTDLESPGGSFVNRQRILSGENRRLKAGDVIQLGGVQLRVVAGPSEVVPPKPLPAAKPAGPKSPQPSPKNRGPLSTPFRLASGAICRTWDDFLTVSAQNWAGLRDELTSGRLATFLKLQGRIDLQPAAAASVPDDDRLDAWLASLPTTRPALPDLDVHPAVVKLRAVAGGGMTRRKLVVTNTGYRLLRSTIKVEPPATDWVRIDSRFTGKTFVTSEQSEISVEVQIPESVSSTLRAFVLVESNGGSRRVEIRVEPVLKSNAIPEASTPEPLAIASGLSERLASVTVGTRIVTFALGAAGVRTVLLAGDWLATRFGSDGSSSPSLGGSALVFGTILGLAAVRSALRRGEGREAFPAGFAGAFGGALFATLAVAACRSIEPVFGTTLSNSALFACGLWLFLGGLVGWLSAQVLPHEQTIPGGEGAAS